MPAFGKLEMQTKPERLSGLDGGDIRSERNGSVRRCDRSALERVRRRHERDAKQRRQTRS
jgi:hypothetical protein